MTIGKADNLIQQIREHLAFLEGTCMTLAKDAARFHLLCRSIDNLQSTLHGLQIMWSNERISGRPGALQSMREQLEELARKVECTTCYGAPNPSGERCVCDGTNRAQVEAENLRKLLATKLATRRKAV